VLITACVDSDQEKSERRADEATQARLGAAEAALAALELRVAGAESSLVDRVERLESELQESRAREEKRAKARPPSYDTATLSAMFGEWTLRLNRATGEVEAKGVSQYGHKVDDSIHELGSSLQEDLRPDGTGISRFSFVYPAVCCRPSGGTTLNALLVLDGMTGTTWHDYRWTVEGGRGRSQIKFIPVDALVRERAGVTRRPWSLHLESIGPTSSGPDRFKIRAEKRPSKYDPNRTPRWLMVLSDTHTGASMELAQAELQGDSHGQLFFPSTDERMIQFDFDMYGEETPAAKQVSDALDRVLGRLSTATSPDFSGASEVVADRVVWRNGWVVR
jgi:hypothetical protein